MITTNKAAPRGRPRRFDPDEALVQAQRLFHEKGYDGVSVADLTQALGIRPPSFYAAFGSKAELYRKVLERYALSGALPLRQILAADQPLGVALTQLLEEAARSYAADPQAAGCLVLQGTHCDDPQARAAAQAYHLAAQEFIRSRIAARQPQQAQELADFVATTMAGLSASARHGQSLERLLASARLAGVALTQTLPAQV
ncbi:TetR/AcrR family transcriptional regulator [Pseudomonas oryzihabitans]|uniref:TetR/AcrR family transcriptional regulator n=1 Tax=Pseudomonas oryzihabitans TaxID=47885 RepID=UPI001F52944E|nr:TetR/AcrR family transcriptional regulator [Pseudomonas oryzihabitans]MCI1008834.1 TetR/AcrR family transcriptional regulator [Pseudomonas oryzihabitans]